MKNDLKDFYYNKKVVITGNTGFKGIWLSLSLAELGAKIFGYSNDHFLQNNFCQFSLKHTHTQQEYGDISDKNKLEKFISKVEPDFIFHLAAQPIVSESYQNPYETIQANVVGTLNLLEISRKRNNKCSIVVITSDKCYKINRNKTEYNESDELGGYDPYSLSKSMQENLTSMYSQVYFSSSFSKVNCCTVRSGNVIGGGDFSYSRLVPDVINAIHNNQSIKLRNPLAIRPWIYVLDSIFSYIRIIQALDSGMITNGESFNIGPDKEERLSVIDFVNLLVQFNPGASSQIEVNLTKEYIESDYLFLDTTKIKNQLNWKNNVHIEKAIEETSNWYKYYHSDPYKAFEYSISIIRNYIKHEFQKV